MAKKYNPKQTVERILTVSAELFSQKGFDKTSTQDIVNALGMSKGAVFYHFKSKEDIFNAVMQRYAVQTQEKLLNFWASSELEGLTALEKLRKLLEYNLSFSEAVAVGEMISSRRGSPHIIVASMRETIHLSAPILSDFIREGVSDGSIHTDFPDECAEVFLLLFNFWCDPSLFEGGSTDVVRRYKFLQILSRQIGLDIVTDKILDISMELFKNIRRD